MTRLSNSLKPSADLSSGARLAAQAAPPPSLPENSQQTILPVGGDACECVC